MDEQIKNQGKKLDSIEHKLDNFISTSDFKYASASKVQRLEKVVYGAVGVVLSVVLIAMVIAASTYIGY